MRAVILAAGVGARLGGLGDDRPAKCLLRPGGPSLLERHLAALEAEGVGDVTLVLGWRSELVEAELDALEDARRPRTVLNERYEEGSVVSLWRARDVLEGGRPVLLMDADVLYDPRILRPLTRGDGNRLLLDRNLEAGDEPVKACVRDGALVEFRKRVDPDLAYDFAGESVGFFRLAAETARRVARRAGAYVSSGRTAEPYEEVLREEILEGPDRFHWVDVTGLPWIEIDFPEDLRRAEREIVPRLERPRAVPGGSGDRGT